MNSLEASIRENTTKGQLNAIKASGNVPAIIYGGKDENQMISISKKMLKNLIEKENFLSNIISLNVNGKSQNVLPREVKYHIISDEPTHVDFLRVLPGVKIKNSVIKNLVITDTIDNVSRTKNVKNIEVLPISGLMGEAIKRISNSTSVSDLFK